MEVKIGIETATRLFVEKRLADATVRRRSYGAVVWPTDDVSSSDLGTVRQNFLRPQFMIFRSKLECLYLAGLFSLV